jgi:hypothetical protein
MAKIRGELKNDLAATVLLEAVYSGDEKAAAKFAVSLRTLRRWRARLPTDADLAGIFHHKKEKFDAAWVDRLAVPIQAAMDFLGDACQTMDARQKNNPEMIKAVADALKVMCELSLTSRFLNGGNGE